MRSLTEVKGVGPVTLAKLNGLGIFTVKDLLDFIPKSYIDLDALSDLSGADEGDYIVAKATVLSVSKPFRKGRLQIFKAQTITEASEKLTLVWYNANYVAKTVCAGAVLRCYGKLKKDKGAELINPAFELENEGESKFKGIKTVYTAKGVINQATMSSIVRDALNKHNSFESLIPLSECERRGLRSLQDAYLAAHLPSDMDEARRGAERVTLEKLVKQICAYRLVRQQSARARLYDRDPSFLSEAARMFPFGLTPTQLSSAQEIVTALSTSDKPLNYMLTGDVGSGKTAVALIACYFAVKNGYQAAVMAPTELLAVQHCETFSRILGSKARIGLITGSTPASQKRAIREAAANGDCDILVGTHSLISAGADFCRLGLAVIDEQHRFGVSQRAALMDKGSVAVDTLTLSATPIPRTLRLTVFGNIDIGYIERRFERSNVSTAVVGAEKKNEMLAFIAERCLEGRQAYIVAPKISDAEGLDISAAEPLYKEISKKFGSKLSVALLHGKMKAEDKRAVLDAFRDNKVQILVSTSVIEVGIDVPNATLMAIFDADRFGLANLHQMRGRIGRDGSESFCFLHTAKGDLNGRLQVLVDERDGMKIAEKDCELRGAGDWLGESQSGGAGAGLILTPAIMREARELADTVDVGKNFEELAGYACAFGLDKICMN